MSLAILENAWLEASTSTMLHPALHAGHCTTPPSPCRYFTHLLLLPRLSLLPDVACRHPASLLASGLFTAMHGGVCHAPDLVIEPECMTHLVDVIAARACSPHHQQTPQGK
jgi:hypothetical protein